MNSFFFFFFFYSFFLDCGGREKGRKGEKEERRNGERGFYKGKGKIWVMVSFIGEMGKWVWMGNVGVERFVG